jgi:hypothetical protein
MDRICKYCTRWRLKISVGKTIATIFTKRRPQYPEQIHMEGLEIPWTNSVKYLGLHLTSTLNYTQHVKQRALKAIGNLITLFPLLARDSTLTMKIKLHLYKSIIRSTMTYAAPVWCAISDSTYQNLQTVQNKCLTVITHSTRGSPIHQLHHKTGVPYMQPHILHLASRFYSRCIYHNNPLNRTIGNYTHSSLKLMYKKYKHKRPRHRLL